MHREQEHPGDVRELDPTTKGSKKCTSQIGWGGTTNVKKPVLQKHITSKSHIAAVAWKFRQESSAAAASDLKARADVQALLDSQTEKQRREWDARVSAVIWLAVHAVHHRTEVCNKLHYL